MTLHIFKDLKQGTDAWHDVRRGIITASVVGKLITSGPPAAISVDCPTCGTVANTPCINAARKLRTEIKSIHEARSAKASSLPPVYSVADNDTSKGIVATLATERITGWTEETPMNADMWRGVESEPFARDEYTKQHAPVEQVGFMRRDEELWSLGYSPDGLVGDHGLIEIKCPRAKTHVRTVLADEVPGHYMAQCQAGLLVSGREWIDFVSYVGGMPLLVKRVTPDPEWFAAITAAAIEFEHNANRIVAGYEERVAGLPKTERIDFTQLGLVF